MKNVLSQIVSVITIIIGTYTIVDYLVESKIDSKITPPLNRLNEQVSSLSNGINKNEERFSSHINDKTIHHVGLSNLEIKLKDKISTVDKRLTAIERVVQ
ncbi:MAG: hypothetical protein R3213_04215 [Flavobacteriaceae bacterium]|nr:hypothetical protein [Flavobacteriaceae bacterium]